MKWRYLLAVLFGLSSSNVATFSQRPPEAERPAPTPSSLYSDMSFGDAGMARFQLVAGRLQLHPSLHRKGRESRDRGDVHESISVQSHEGRPSLQYAFQSPACQFSLSVKDGKSVRLEIVAPADGPRHVLEQFEGRAVRWIGEHELQAGSLLHLRQLAPERFDETFGDILSHLLSGISLSAHCRQTDAALLAMIADGNLELPTKGRILALVEQLSAAGVATRIAAQRELVRAGTPILKILAEVPDDQLDAEQDYRIDQIRRALESHRDDTVASWASRLIMDRRYLAGVTAGLPIDRMLAVNAHLDAVGIRPISVEDHAVMQVVAHPSASSSR